MANANAFAVHRYLYEKLTADTALCAEVGGTASPRIYERGQVPQAAAFPYVVFEAVTAGSNGATINGTRTLQQWVFQVTAHNNSANLAALETIGNRIHAALHKTSGTVTGGTILYAVEEAEIVPPPLIDSGITYRQVGGEYRLYTQG